MKKYNLVIPLMGKAKRMKDSGINTPKCLIKIGDKTNLEWGLDSIQKDECRLIFVLRKDQPEVKEFINSKYPDAITIVKDGETSGSLHTVTLAYDYINNDIPLIVFNPDVAFFPIYKPEIEDFQDGLILTFKSNSPNYSYVQVENNLVVKTAEKLVISNLATCGLYCFKSGKLLLDNFPFAQQTNNETYVCPFYNQLIGLDYKIKYKEVDKFYVFGIPSELDFMQKYVLPTRKLKKFVLCFDHSGQNTRKHIIEALEQFGVEYIDVGAYSDKDCNYCDYTKRAAEYIRKGYFCLASCRSGQGINISLNKLDGVLSANIRYISVEQMVNDVRLAIKHNCVNSISFADTDNINTSAFISIISIILMTSFDGGRHTDRIMGVLYADK